MDAKAIARQWAIEEGRLEENTRSYVVSIYSEQRTTADDLAQETGHTQIEIDHETVDADTLRRYGQDYGISQASSSHITPGENRLWFYSVTPREDQAYFEQGVETYYSLHVHAVNDRDPQAHDYQQLAKMIGVRLETTPAFSQKDVNINAELNPGSLQHDHEF
jgi:short subunit dehydrogenase-like uncharacterized protein